MLLDVLSDIRPGTQADGLIGCFAMIRADNYCNQNSIRKLNITRL